MKQSVDVLLVEDSATDALLARQALAGSLYQVESYDRLAAAIERLSEKQFDLVLLDLGLPDSQGLDTLRAVMEATSHSTAVVIVLTGNEDEDIALQALNNGALDYLVKRDLQAETLQRALRYTLERAAILQELQENQRLLEAMLSARAAEAARTRSILDHMFGAVITIDEEGSIEYCNPGVEQLFGYAPDELLGQNLCLIVPDPFKGGHDDYMAAYNATGVAHILGTEREVPGQRRDGTTFPMRLAVTEFIANGKRYFTGVMHDLTELANESSRLRAILDNTSDAILLIDSRKLVTLVNAAAQQMGGYTAAELIGQPAIGLTPSEVRSQLDSLLDEMLSGKRLSILGFETKGLRKDGTTYPAELTANAFELSGERFLIVTARDITERKQAEEDLIRSREALLEAQRIAHMGSWEWNLLSDEVQWSAERYTIFGIEPGSVKYNEQVKQYLHPDDLPLLSEEIEKVRTTPGPFHVEYRILRPDGDLRYLESRGRAYADESGRPAFARGLVQDVTDRKLAEIERESLQAQLRQSQKLEAIGKLAGGVAHDFNNMLTVINAYSQMGLERVSSKELLHEYLTEILHAGERAALITQQLLAFSRQQVLSPRVLDLNHVIAETEKMLRRLIGEDISVASVLSPEIGHVLVDQGQIVQVLMNLAVNARDAMPQGGKLTIATKPFMVDDERLKERPDYAKGMHVLLSVTDTGLGMPAEVRAHIFEPFFTTKGPGEGTGLGLSTVYGIVKQSNGNIDVYSEPGQGTTFKIYLPSVDKDAPAIADGSSPGVMGGTETILLVEDDPAVRKVAWSVLTEQGYHVLVASHGAEALAMAAAHAGRINLLLTDLIMPEMSGRQLASQLLNQLTQLRVLYMSGYTDDAVVRHGLVDGGTPFLQKPFTPNSLAAKVREVLDKPG